MKTMMLVIAFVLAIGSAQAKPPDYHIKMVTLQDERTGEPKAAVTFTSPIDGKSHFIGLEAWKQAIREGKALARFYIQRGEKPTGDQMRKVARERASQVYGSDSCSCMEVVDRRRLHMYPGTPHFRLKRWEMRLDDEPAASVSYYNDFQLPDPQTKCVRVPLNKKPGIFDPADAKRGKMSRTKEWEHTLRIAIEAVERLLELQESFNESAMKLPEGFADSDKGRYYDQVVDVDVGGVHKALVELYDAQAIEEPPR
jgi:hypothetical protein